MDDLVVELTLPAAVERGALIIGEVTVRNEGPSRSTVSSWLGLAEGDLWLDVRDPAGRKRTLHGRHQLDVLPQNVTLDRGQAIARGVQVSVTSDPHAFDQSGTYRLRAVYAPAPTVPTVESDDRQLVVEPARTTEQRDMADLLAPDVVGDAIALGHVDPGSRAAASLARIAADHPNRVEGAIARILLAAQPARAGFPPAWDAVFRDLGPKHAARLVTAVQPPAAGRDDPLIRAAADHVTTQDAGPAGVRAAAMLGGMPFTVTA